MDYSAMKTEEQKKESRKNVLPNSANIRSLGCRSISPEESRPRSSWRFRWAFWTR